MKATANRSYPYPECNPPYVKDTADLPANLKALAEAVDDDVTILAAQIAAALNPPSARLRLSGSTLALASGVPITLDFVDFDNTAGQMPQIGFNRMRCISAGFYTVAGFCQGSLTAGTVQGHQLQILVNGAAAASNSSPPLTTAAAVTNRVVGKVLLAVGDLLTLTHVFPGGSTFTYNAASMAVTRMVAL